jgi:hypothetical protein
MGPSLRSVLAWAAPQIPKNETAMVIIRANPQAKWINVLLSNYMSDNSQECACRVAARPSKSSSFQISRQITGLNLCSSVPAIVSDCACDFDNPVWPTSMLTYEVNPIGWTGVRA